MKPIKYRLVSNGQTFRIQYLRKRWYESAPKWRHWYDYYRSSFVSKELALLKIKNLIDTQAAETRGYAPINDRCYGGSEHETS